MAEYLEFDTAPCEENCVQVDSKKDYMPEMRAEALRYVAMLEARFPNAPGEFRVKSNPHDFGSYLEVRYYYNNEDENELNWAYFIEGNLPSRWDSPDIFTEIPS